MKGARALLEGFELVLSPGLKRFILVPVAINLVIFAVLVASLLGWLGAWVTQAEAFLPSYLAWLTVAVQIFAFLVALVLFVLGFTVINGFIAAPLYGILAEKVETRLDPSAALPSETLGSMIMRTLGREVDKWLWYLPRALILLAISFVPVVNLASPILWLGFGAWVMVIEYRDYLNDNNGLKLKVTREQAWTEPMDSAVFGALVLALTAIPLVNLLVPSAAVAGATAWGVRNRAISARLPT